MHPWNLAGLFPPEVHKQAAEVLGVLLHPVVQRLDVLALQEPQHVLLELARALAGDDLDYRRLLRDSLVEDPLQRPLDFRALIVDVVQVQLQLHAARLRRTHRAREPGHSAPGTGEASGLGSPSGQTSAMILAAVCSGSPSASMV